VSAGKVITAVVYPSSHCTAAPFCSLLRLVLSTAGAKERRSVTAEAKVSVMVLGATVQSNASATTAFSNVRGSSGSIGYRGVEPKAALWTAWAIAIP
jgi:hypothetical protein